MRNLGHYIQYFHDSGITQFLGEVEMKQQIPSVKEVIHDVALIDAIDKVQTLVDLEKLVREFRGCALKKTANKTVFADGNPKASVMFIGEAPGANEDVQGIPFCGQSGKLLDNIIKSMGFVRSDVYITNTVFWRPPANRRPTPEEIELCRPFVQKHIALVEPKIIVLVGSTAVEALLNSTQSMHSLRSENYSYHNPYLKSVIPTTVIFHPSYLLRQPQKKKLMWEDVCKIKHLLSYN
jgi:uracil-DNA glycosylase family 4